MKTFVLILLLSVSFSSFSSVKTDAIASVSDAEFAQAIDSGLVLVDFWAIWCGPCVRQGRELASLATNTKDYLTIYKMDVDKNTAIPSRFLVTSIPTMIIFRDGKMLKRLVGYHTQAELEIELQKIR